MGFEALTEDLAKRWERRAAGGHPNRGQSWAYGGHGLLSWRREIQSPSAGTDETGASHLAKRIRIEIERQLKHFNGENINATCSFGLADTEMGADQSLLDRADAALKSTKRSGRNCIYQQIRQSGHDG